MAYLSGSHGSLWVDTGVDSAGNPKNNVYDKPLAKVKSWNLTQSTQAVDTTTLQDTDRTFVAGLRSYTGSASFFYFPDTAQQVPGLSSLIRRGYATRLPDEDNDDDTYNKTGEGKRPDTYGFKLYMADNTDESSNPTAKGYYIQLRAVITELSISVGVGEVTSGNMSFQVIGALQKVEA